jgi:hypothetical protein
MRTGRFARVGTLGAVIVFALAFVHATPARAEDRVDALTKTLQSSSSEKERLSAVVALAKLGGKPTLKPLVTALADPNSKVRATACGALGHLGHPAAVPALRELAGNDADASVRAHARTAIDQILKANHLPAEAAPAPADDVAAAPAQSPAAAEATARRNGGFGHSPHAVAQHADLYVTVKSSADDSPGKADKASRKLHAEIVKETLLAECQTQPFVTTVEADAQRWGLDPRHIDLSVVKLEATPVGPYMEIEAQLRLAVSDDTGKMESFLSGGAKVQVPRRTFDLRQMPALRKEALENAMRGMMDKLVAHLRKTAQS